MRRITKAALGGLAGCALVIGTTQAASGGSQNIAYTYSGPLTDLLPSTDGPFDEKEATLRIIESPDEGTGFKLRVEGIDPAAAGDKVNAHLHVGECALAEDGVGNLTGGHYNKDGPSGAVTAENEVWFDLVPNSTGAATDETWAQFVPIDKDSTPGIMSIVIHAHEANASGTYPKQACLPVEVSEWGL